jgi:hypothetical protein
MKKSFLFLSGVVLLSSISINAHAQHKKIAMPDEGFWIIESNVKTPTQNTVYFYSNNRKCIGKQEMNGKKINVARRKVVKELNALLKLSLTAYHQRETKDNDTMLAKWIN